MVNRDVVRRRIKRGVVRRMRVERGVVRRRMMRVRRSGSLNFNFYPTTMDVFTIHSLLCPTDTCTYKPTDTKKEFHYTYMYIVHNKNTSTAK